MVVAIPKTGFAPKVTVCWVESEQPLVDETMYVAVWEPTVGKVCDILWTPELIPPSLNFHSLLMFGSTFWALFPLKNWAVKLLQTA